MWLSGHSFKPRMLPKWSVLKFIKNAIQIPKFLRKDIISQGSQQVIWQVFWCSQYFQPYFTTQGATDIVQQIIQDI